MENTTFSITELEDATKINRRTIHYYSQKKIIPPPEGKGGSAKYGLRHYYSLILINLLVHLFQLFQYWIRGLHFPVHLFSSSLNEPAVNTVVRIEKAPI